MVYLEISTQKFVESLPPVPVSKDKPQSDGFAEIASEVDKPLSVDQTQQETDQTKQEMAAIENETSANFDWTADREPHLHKESSDPFSDYLAEQEKVRGTWILEGMSGDELWNAELNQMIEQFGDIPAVHTVMKYTHMFNNNEYISPGKSD